MKRKGFTLVELLACLVILSLVMLIIFPFVLNGYNKARQQSYDAQIAYVKTAAKRFVSDNKYAIPELSTINTAYSVTIQYLYEHNYLDLPINNPLTNKDINAQTSTVVITRISEDKFTYEIHFVE